MIYRFTYLSILAVRLKKHASRYSISNRRPKSLARATMGVFFIGVLLSACHSSNKNDTETLADQVRPSDFQGVWEQTGYGRLLDINGEEAKLFEFTRETCIQTEELSSVEIDQFVETSTLSANKDSLENVIKGELFTTSYDRREALPASCQPGELIVESTPSTVFDHVWHNFNDYYAFFEERHVDWEAQGAQYRPLVHDAMTDEQLFELLSEMLDPLDDDHVELSADTETFEAEFSPAHDAFVFENELAEAFSHQTDFDDVDEYTSFQVKLARKLPLASVSNLKQAGLIGGIAPAIYWGTINGDVAYVNVTRMFLFDEAFDIEDDNFEYDAEQDMEALNRILNKVMAELKDTRAMIIDVRLNYGGSDFASLEIANRFAADELQVISKFARSYSGDTPIKYASTTPVSDPYLKPLVVLSSQETGSAAEIFLMAMNTLSNVTLVGEASNGRLSEILDKELPNGWELGLSNEVYSDYQNKRYEVTGVPVDIEVKALSLTDIEKGSDTALNRALASF